MVKMEIFAVCEGFVLYIFRCFRPSHDQLLIDWGSMINESTTPVSEFNSSPDNLSMDGSSSGNVHTRAGQYTRNVLNTESYLRMSTIHLCFVLFRDQQFVG